MYNVQYVDTYLCHGVGLLVTARQNQELEGRGKVSNLLEEPETRKLKCLARFTEQWGWYMNISFFKS